MFPSIELPGSLIKQGALQVGQQAVWPESSNGPSGSTLSALGLSTLAVTASFLMWMLQLKSSPSVYSAGTLPPIQPPAPRLSPNSYCHPQHPIQCPSDHWCSEKMCASEGHALLPSPYNFRRKNREAHFGEEIEVYRSKSQVQIQRTKY